VLRGPMPAMMDAEVAGVSRVMLARLCGFYMRFGCRAKDGSAQQQRRGCRGVRRRNGSVAEM
jgi:hypothetical protein